MSIKDKPNPPQYDKNSEHLLRNIERHGLYNALPAFMYWNIRGEDRERTEIANGDYGEFVIGHPSKNGDYATIPLYGDAVSYRLLNGSYKGELYFRGKRSDGSVFTKLFGVLLLYKDGVFSVGKIEL